MRICESPTRCLGIISAPEPSPDLSHLVWFCQDASSDNMSLTDQLAFFEMEADAIKKVTLSSFPEIRAGRQTAT